MRSVAILLIGVAALSAASLTSAAIQAQGNWNELVVLDCNGGLHWGDSQPLWRMGADFSVGQQLWDYVVAKTQSRIKCHCPSLSQDMVNLHFDGSFLSVLRWMESTKYNMTSDLLSCMANPMTAFTRDVLGIGNSFDVNLPSTCSSALWAAGQPCLLQYPLAIMSGISFQLAVDHCPNTNQPFVSLSCSGTACEDFLRPCNSNGDCSTNQQCSPFWSDADTQNALNWLQPALNNANLFNTQDQCTADDGTPLRVDTIGQWSLTKLLGLLATYVGQSGGAVTQLGFCNAGAFRAYGNFWRMLASGCQNTAPPYQMSTIDCGLLPWNGALAWGTPAEQANSARRKAGQGFAPYISAGTYPPNSGDPLNIVTVTCGDNSDGSMVDQIGGLLNGPIPLRTTIPVVHQAAQSFMDVVSELTTCRSGGVAMGADQFDVRFNPFSIAPELMAATTHAAFPPVPVMPDPYTAYYNYLTRNLPPSTAWPQSIVNLPASCTLSTWLSTGTCGVQWSGLSTLINEDVTFRLGLYRCGNAANTIAGTMDCVGSGCANVMQPYQTGYCVQDSDCSGGRTCQQVPIIGTFVSRGFWDVYVSAYTLSFNLQPPAGNYTFFSSMTPAQQLATRQQLLTDLMTSYNNGVAQWNINNPSQQIANLSSNAVASNVFAINYYYWSTYPYFNLVVTPMAAGLNGNSASSVASATVYWDYYTQPGSLRTLPIGQYVNGIYSYASSSYVRCPDGTYAPSKSQCPTLDACDNEGQMEADVLSFILQVTKQTVPPISPTGMHGYCATVFNNISNVNAWANTQYAWDPTRTNPRVLSFPAASAYTPPNPPQPSPTPSPPSGSSGLSDGAKAGVVVGVVGGVGILGAAAYMALSKKKNAETTPLAPGSSSANSGGAQPATSSAGPQPGSYQPPQPVGAQRV